MKRKREIFRNIIVVVMVITLPFLLMQSARLMTFAIVLDPIELEIMRTFGTNKLTVDSKLVSWIDELGEPDLVVRLQYPNDFLKRVYTEFYWLNYGIAVEVEGEYKSVSSAYESKILEIILPTQNKLPSIYMNPKYRVLISPDEQIEEIEFKRLPDVRLNGTNIEKVTVEDIRAIYPHYDASNHDHYSIPFPFITHHTWFDCKADKNQKGDIEEYCIISLKNGDLFTVKKYLIVFWTLFFEFPYRLVTGIS